MRNPAAAQDRQADVTAPSVVEHDALSSALNEPVEAALRRLPADQQRVVEVADVAGLSCRDAADLLEIPVGTVMSRLRRARRRLRASLLDAGYVGRVDR